MTTVHLSPGVGMGSNRTRCCDLVVDTLPEGHSTTLYSENVTCPRHLFMTGARTLNQLRADVELRRLTEADVARIFDVPESVLGPDASADYVNHPPHYTSHPSGIECIEVTRHMGFNLGNALKYIWRADEKGNALEDLEKAIWYLQDELAKRAEQ